MSNKTSSGIGIGGLIAGILSWGANHSILWLFIHVTLGWFYVFYYAFFR